MPSKRTVDLHEYFSPSLVSWLKQTPAVTTYRINLLKSSASDIVEIITTHLEKEKLKYGRPSAPKVRQISTDTVTVERWPAAPGDSETANNTLQSATVDAACGIAVLRGSRVFAPGVMALPPDVPLNAKINIYSDIAGQCRRGSKLEFENEHRLFVGTGILRQSRAELFNENKKATGVAIDTVMPASRVPVIDDEIFPLGSCMLQNLPSIICSKVLDPQKGDNILDMCAAPGNKTTHIAEIIQNEGTIIALDKVASKIQSITSRCSLRSITCVHPFSFDATKAVLDVNSFSITNKSVISGPPFCPESFDKILLDAPCSALGQRPMLKWDINEKVLKSYVPLQRKLFHSAVRLLRKNGRLVYSTCTVTLGECEDMVAWALKTFPDLTLAPAEPLMGGPGCKDSQLTDEQRIMVQRYGPDEGRNLDPVYGNSIGFFIALFIKI